MIVFPQMHYPNLTMKKKKNQKNQSSRTSYKIPDCYSFDVKAIEGEKEDQSENLS